MLPSSSSSDTWLCLCWAADQFSSGTFSVSIKVHFIVILQHNVWIVAPLCYTRKIKYCVSVGVLSSGVSQPEERRQPINSCWHGTGALGAGGFYTLGNLEQSPPIFLKQSRDFRDFLMVSCLGMSTYGIFFKWRFLTQVHMIINTVPLHTLTWFSSNGIHQKLITPD